MKKLIAITSLFIFIGSTAGAVERLKDIKSVNSLIKKGYKLVSTNKYDHPTEYGGIIYNLMTGYDLITCTINGLLSYPEKPFLSCLRP